MNIAIASDHAGLDLKREIARLLRELGHGVTDFGTHTAESVDYPDFGVLVADAVAGGKVERGVLICGTGIGMSIVANRFTGVRAALCHDPFTAGVSRRHNDANVLVLGQRVMGVDLALATLRTWLDTEFEGGRHERRVAKLDTAKKS
jgi:ribose 5-phosphate isomerase B